MKLALVNLPKEDTDPPLGLAYIAAYLRKYAAFHSTVIIDEPDPLDAVRRERPDIVGISVLSFLFPEADKLAARIKAELKIPVIIGGHHISMLPLHLEASHFDIGVLGEGEETMKELLSAFETDRKFTPRNLRRIKGIVFRNEEGKNELTEPRPLIEPLDRIPFPARDLLDMRRRYLVPKRIGFPELGIYTAMLTSRGCPYQCAFCMPRAFWRGFRTFSPERVVAEMQFLMETYKLDGIMIWDDLFAVDKPRLKRIVELAEAAGIPDRMQFSVFSRANLITEETAALLERLHVTSVLMGLESGSPRILEYLKKGSVTVDDNYRALRLCKQHGMRTIATLIIGAPEETEEDIEATRRLIGCPDLDQAILCHLTPLPGTEVWETAKEAGVVSEDIGWNYGSLSSWLFHPEMVLTRNLSREKLEQLFWEIHRDVQRRRFRENIGAVKFRYYFHPRLIQRVLRNWRDYSRYIKHRLSC